MDERKGYIVAHGGWCAPPDALGWTTTLGPTMLEQLFENEPMPTVPRGGFRYEATLEKVSLEAMAIMTNIPLVDLSIEYDTHIIRGEQ